MDDEIPSTSRTLHVPTENVMREKMSFFAEVKPSEIDLEREKKFLRLRELFENSKSGRPLRPCKKYGPTWEHTQFGKVSAKTTCPNCLAYVQTDVKHYSNTITHLVASSLVPVCMCLLPYFSVKFKDTIHRCPRCEIYLGIKFSKGKCLFEHCPHMHRVPPRYIRRTIV